MARTNDSSNCQKCQNMVWIYIKFVLGMIFILGYTYVQVKVYGQINKGDPSVAILLKLLLNHLQIIALVTLVPLGWTVNFNVFFSVQEYFSFLYQDFFNIDCIVTNINQNLLTQRVIFVILLPILIGFIMIVFWIISFICNFYKNRSNFKGVYFFLSEKMRVSFLTLFFIFYPDIVRRCFMLLNCLVINDTMNLSVLKYSPDIQCWDSEHTSWVLSISLPGLAVWGVFTPLMILFFLYKHRFSINEITASLVSLGVIESNEKTVIKKCISIMIDEKLKDTFFGKQNIEFPINKTFTYEKKNYFYILVFNPGVK